MTVRSKQSMPLCTKQSMTVCSKHTTSLPPHRRRCIGIHIRGTAPKGRFLTGARRRRAHPCRQSAAKSMHAKNKTIESDCIQTNEIAYKNTPKTEIAYKNTPKQKNVAYTYVRNIVTLSCACFHPFACAHKHTLIHTYTPALAMACDFY